MFDLTKTNLVFFLNVIFKVWVNFDFWIKSYNLHGFLCTKNYNFFKPNNAYHYNNIGNIFLNILTTILVSKAQQFNNV